MSLVTYDTNKCSFPNIKSDVKYKIYIHSEVIPYVKQRIREE